MTDFFSKYSKHCYGDTEKRKLIINLENGTDLYNTSISKEYHMNYKIERKELQ
jgi:hypothetical protein